METEGNLLQKMKNVFSDNEDKEKIAETLHTGAKIFAGDIGHVSGGKKDTALE